jgi:hypothetical protein
VKSRPPYAKELYRRLAATASFGPLCYFPEFLRGVASTLSVCSQNHEDGVLLALMAFAAGLCMLNPQLTHNP